MTETPFPASTITTSPTPPDRTETPTVTPDAICQEVEGRLEQVSYSSVVLNAELEVRVYLPPCYDQSELLYPAIYFFHGSPPSSADWVAMGTPEKMDRGIMAGYLPPAVLVFPLQPDPLFLWSDGGPNSYEEEFFSGLVPYVESYYRVDSMGEQRALAGISRGGIWALEISMYHLDDFSSVAALSPALQYNDPRELYDPFKIPERVGRSPENLLLLAGEDDWARNETESLAAQLAQQGKPVDLRIFPGSHISTLWESALDEVLLFLTAYW